MNYQRCWFVTPEYTNVLKAWQPDHHAIVTPPPSVIIMMALLKKAQPLEEELTHYLLPYGSFF